MIEYKIFKDGNLWCAVTNDFINIQESDAGFGLTPGFALKELLDQIEDNKNYKED